MITDVKLDNTINFYFNSNIVGDVEILISKLKEGKEEGVSSFVNCLKSSRITLTMPHLKPTLH